MSWELVGQVDRLVSPPLGHHYDAADLLHLGVVWGTGAIEVASDLSGHTTQKVNTKKTLDNQCNSGQVDSLIH